jgi:signal transduction histidine kinase
MVRTTGDFLQVNRVAVATSWLDKIRAELPTAPSLTTLQTVDSMLVFLDQMGRDLGSDGPVVETNDVAREHGWQRHAVGMGLPELVREYGLCFVAISELTEERGEPLTANAQRAVARYLSNAASQAVAEYASRDLEHRQRTDFENFAFVAHEIRGPLSMLRLALEMTTDVLPPGTAAVLRHNLDRATSLLDASIANARVSFAGQMRVERHRVRDLVQAAIDEVAFKAQQRGIRLVAEVAGDVTVEGDSRLLHSVFVNLIGNGARFSRLGSVVRTRALIDEGRVLVEIRDQCGGLRNADVRTMFAAFQQVGDDRGGSGLGLALTKQAVEAHGGTLNVVNDEGVGCRFVVDLPCPGAP